MTQTSQFERERAKRLYAAIMSSRMGTSFQTEYQQVQDLGSWWYDLSDLIDRAVTNKLEEIVKLEKEGAIQ